MKKTTINAILIAAIFVMSVSICFLIFFIATRPRYITVTEPETAVITEAPTSPETIQNDSNEDASSAESSTTALHGKTSTRVNIRDAASVDAKVLYTVESGTTFDIIEVQDSGWTKIIYDGTEAYISSDYVIIVTD